MSVTAEKLTDFEQRSAEEILGWAFDEFGDKVAISTSFQAEGMAVVDIAWRINKNVRVFTLDTGRLPNETYTLMDDVRQRYGIDIEVKAPDPMQTQAMIGRHGMNLFYRDVALRQLCCHVRKVVPLDKALKGLDAWVTGLRREQAVTRNDTPKVEIDERHGGIVKINPLADWTKDEVWEYVRANKVPTNALYEKGFTSIGCEPCTRATQPGEDERAGRWWWEADADKECGLHHGTPDERFAKELAWLKFVTE
jgi:thioredoxin-dependent adenylylsulfate APS reductase